MKQQLETIRQLALKAIEEAKDQQGLENLRVKYLGKKGELTAILKQMGKLSAVGTYPLWGNWPMMYVQQLKKLSRKKQRIRKRSIAGAKIKARNHRRHIARQTQETGFQTSTFHCT